MAEFNFLKIGPAGKNGGNPWDEKGKTDIVQIFIWHTKKSICAIQFQYANENGKPVFSDRYGSGEIPDGCGDTLFNLVRLNHPSEYITSIRGYYNSDYITSLEFGTNHGEYGPFGGRSKSTYLYSDFKFELGKKARQFGGFYGTANNRNVLSVGIHLRPIELLKSPNSNQANGHKIKEESKT